MLKLVDQLGSMPIALVIFLTSAVVLLGFVRGHDSGPPVPVAKPFMTAREQAMFEALEYVLPMYRVHAQVAMGALLMAPRKLGGRFNPADRNAFSQKIIDFVVVNPANGKVVALVELDDSSHNAARDRVRDAMTARAGYRTIRIPGSARPTMHTAIQAVGHLRGEGDHDGDR